jgi:hypothetical protein
MIDAGLDMVAATRSKRCHFPLSCSKRTSHKVSRRCFQMLQSRSLFPSKHHARCKAGPRLGKFGLRDARERSSNPRASRVNERSNLLGQNHIILRNVVKLSRTVACCGPTTTPISVPISRARSAGTNSLRFLPISKAHSSHDSKCFTTHLLGRSLQPRIRSTGVRRADRPPTSPTFGPNRI